jgi:predicted MPP superfamily phosphohydrolase
VQLTDIHFGHSPTEEKDLKTQALIRNILEWEKPDLVAVTGDVISGNKWDKTTKGWAERQYRKLTDVLTEKR